MPGAGEPPVSLAVMMLLRLLITWANDCAPALEALLAPPGHLPMLLELAQKRYPAAIPLCHECTTHTSCTGPSLSPARCNELNLFRMD